MRSTKVVHVVSCHAEGEVGDVIVGGVAPPPGETLWEQSRFIANDKVLRDFVAPRLHREPARLRTLQEFVQSLATDEQTATLLPDPGRALQGLIDSFAHRGMHPGQPPMPMSPRWPRASSRSRDWISVSAPS